MSWTCAVCTRPHNHKPDLKTGLCSPSYDQAEQLGFKVQRGRWLPLFPREAPPAGSTRKNRKVKPPGLFDNLPAFEEEPELSFRREDWEG